MRKAFPQAVGYFVQLVDQVPDDLWGSAGLGVWAVRDLVGHTSWAIKWKFDSRLTTSCGPWNPWRTLRGWLKGGVDRGKI